jgi:hypothetical protein
VFGGPVLYAAPTRTRLYKVKAKHQLLTKD